MYLRFLVTVGMAGAILAGTAQSAGKWRMVYFYDRAHATLIINDLQFPAPGRGIAVGYVDEEDQSRPVSVTTNDGGAHWSLAHLKQIPVSLFFLNQTLGWMVTPKSIWRTTDAGRSWHELPKSPKLLMEVYFLDESRGFAVGEQKQALATSDGGKTWTPIAAAAEPQSAREYTLYNSITFVDEKTGLINGYHEPPRGGNRGRPEWLSPKTTTQRKELPHLSIMLDTRDGGQTWKSSTTSMFGRITRTVFLTDGRGLGLIEFTNTFKWPSEVHRLDGISGTSDIVYNAKDRAITDVLLLPSGRAYLVGVDVVGELQHSPIPNKLEILTSDDLSGWREMDVDYRANAIRAILRVSGDGSLWAATDTGMILKLQE